MQPHHQSLDILKNLDWRSRQVQKTEENFPFMYLPLPTYFPKLLHRKNFYAGGCGTY